MSELTDCVELIGTLFGLYEPDRMNQDGEKAGSPYIFGEASFIIIFVLMQCRRIFDSKSQ